MGQSVKVGIAWAFLCVFPLAALVALCYRFPIPFAGYESGPAAVPLSLFAVAIYGLFGGFLVLIAIGVAAGMAAYRIAGPDAKRARLLTFAFALSCDLVAVLILASLDKIIGKW